MRVSREWQHFLIIFFICHPLLPSRKKKDNILVDFHLLVFLFLQIIIVCKFRVNRNKIVSSLSLHRRVTGIEHGMVNESSPIIEQYGTTLFRFIGFFPVLMVFKRLDCLGFEPGKRGFVLETSKNVPTPAITGI